MRDTCKLIASFSAAVLLCLNTLPSAAQSKPFEAAKNIPSNIHSVTSGGFWTHAKDEGFFRVVVVAGGVEHVWHRLFIQWLRSDATTQSYELIRTVNVRELNMGQGYVLDVKTSFGEFNAVKIDVTANSQRVKSKRFAITANGIGKYVIRSR